MDPCDVYNFTDFGHGLVEIRCTTLGPHERHTCVVPMRGDDSPVEHQHTHRNLFDKEGDENINLQQGSIRKNYK